MATDRPLWRSWVAHGDPEHFKVATGFAFGLDVLSGIIGLIGRRSAAALHRTLDGISHEYLWLAMFYCTVLPVMSSATPDGVLRVLDRFDLISWSGTLTPITRAVLAAMAFAAGAAFPVYVAVWFVTDLAGRSLSVGPRLAGAQAARPSRGH